MKLPSRCCACSSSRPRAAVTSSSARRARMSSRRLSIGLLFDLAFEQQRRRRLSQRASKPLFKLPQLVQGHFGNLSAQDDIDVYLHLRRPQPAVKKLGYSLQTIRRLLGFVAHYLDQISYGLARMASRFKAGRTLLLGQFSRTAARVRGNAGEPVRIARLAHGYLVHVASCPSNASHASLGDGRACLERAGCCQPGDRRLRHVEGSREISLHRTLREALDDFMTLMGCQSLRTSEFHATGLRALSAVICTSADQLSLEFREAAEYRQHQAAVRRRGVGPCVLQ